MTRQFALLAALLLVAARMDARPAERHDAQGALTINGKDIPLKHAYAVAELPELAMPDSGKDGYDLIVTDRPLTAAELDCRTLLQYRARKGNVAGIILAVDPSKRASERGTLLYQDKQVFFSILGASDEYKFNARTCTRDAVAGRAWMPNEKDMAVTGGPLQVRYDVTVDATVRRPPPVSATLTGAAASKSPQAAAVVAFCRAARAGSIAGIRQLGVPEQLEMLEGPDGKQFLAMMRQAMPNPASIKVPRITVRGNLSVVHAKAPAPLGETTIKCYLRDGKWRVSLN